MMAKEKMKMGNNFKRKFLKGIRIFMKLINSIWGNKRKGNINGLMMKIRSYQ